MSNNVIQKVRQQYKNIFLMPKECAEISCEKNSRHILYFLPFTFAFGLLGLALTFFTDIYKNNYPHFVRAFSYYGLFVLCSAISFVWIFICKKKLSSIHVMKCAQYFTFICFQIIGLMNLSISNFSSTGVVVWMIITLVIITVFDVNPFFYLVTTVVQLTYIFLVNKSYSILWQEYANFIIYMIIIISLSFTHWNLIIREFKAKKSMEAANKKSEELLLNILPPKVIKELKEKGSSTPESFSNVTIMLTDMVDFTEISKTLPPSEVIEELNDIFSNFDRIVNNNNCTRIKTIGDGYMAVCGLPESNKDNVNNILCSCLDIIDYLNKRNSTHKIQWKTRIGVNTGNVIAGIVGKQKYIYDVFGDSVNTASRMEHLSEAMKINITKETYSVAKELFNAEEREPQIVKGKGMMTMYFITNKK